MLVNINENIKKRKIAEKSIDKMDWVYLHNYSYRSC